MRFLLVGLAFLSLASLASLAACAEPPDRSAPERPIRKPSAPVTMTLDARPVAGGHRVTLAVTPTQDAVALDVRLEAGVVRSGPTRLQFGATPAGVRRELVADVDLEQGGIVLGHAAITTANGTRSRSIEWSTAPAARAIVPPARVITLPDGTRVAETRP